MSFGFSVGDFLAIGALLATTIRKCRSASSEFEELSQILQTISCCVESARNTLDGIYEGLPIVHQRSVASAMIGLKNLATSLDQEA